MHLVAARKVRLLISFVFRSTAFHCLSYAYACLLRAFWIMLYSFWVEDDTIRILISTTRYGYQLAGFFTMLRSIIYAGPVWLMNFYY